MGQPGVAAGVVSNPSFTNFSLATGFVKSAVFETLARSTWGPFGYARTRILRKGYDEISVTASYAAHKRAYAKIKALGGDLLDPSIGLGKSGSGKYTRVFKLGRGLTTIDDLIRNADLPTKGGWKANVVFRNVDELVETSRYARLYWIKNSRLGLATDVVLSAGIQGYEDSYNPYFTPGQRIARATVAGTGGALSFVAGYFTTVGLTSVACGPGAGVCAIAIGGGIAVTITAGAIWSYGIQPVIFENVEALQPPPRNLEPLVTN
jgi:hypothetical protein